MTFSLDKLEQLEKAATPGPWWYDDGVVYPIDEPPFVEQKPALKLGKEEYIEFPGYGSSPDAELIAEMRNSLPAILRRLRAADALRDGFSYTYHRDCVIPAHFCEICRVISKYDKDVANEEN